MVKRCGRCQEDVPVENFGPASKKPDGLQAWCKPCFIEYRRAARLRDPEKFRKRYRDWAARHPEDVKRRRSEHYEANREKSIADVAEWRRKNRERFNRNAARSNAKRRGEISGDDETQDYVDILRSDPCAYCGDPGGTIDHVVPLAHGGGRTWENLTAACGSCNSSKHTQPLLQWMLRQRERESSESVH